MVNTPKETAMSDETLLEATQAVIDQARLVNGWADEAAYLYWRTTGNQYRYEQTCLLTVRCNALQIKLNSTPKPDTSPVCVEVAAIKWRNSSYDLIADTALGQYLISDWPDGVGRIRFRGRHLCDARLSEIGKAKALCRADFERRVLELVNARSVADVRAEARAEYEAELRESSTTWHKAARPLTEGER